MSALQASLKSQSIQESTTLAISAKANLLKSQGQDVVSLSAGEPDFGTPESVCQAAIQAIQNGQTRYTAATGTPELKAAAAQWFEREFNLNYGPKQIMATAGVKPGLQLALMSLINPGDKVLIPCPYWVSYPAMINIAGGISIDLPGVPDQDFVHSGEQIMAAAKEHGAKGIILNFPNNPSGAVPSKAQIEEIVHAARETGMWVLSDEIYFKLLYDGAEHFSAAAVPGAKDFVVVATGGTKSHSLTGWRIGLLAGPEEIIAAAGRMQSQAMGNPCSISQAAAVAACADTFADEMDMRMQAFSQRRAYLLEEVNKIPGMSLRPPKGAFYALVDVRPLCEKLQMDDAVIVNRLLEEQLLAVVPGSAFAMPGFIRLSYAASMEDLNKGVARLRAFVDSCA